MRRPALAAGAVIVGFGLVASVVAFAQKPTAQWDVHVPEKIEIAQGAVGELSIGIAVDRGLVVSKDASVIVDLTAPPGVTIKKKRLQRPDAVDPQADAPRFAANVRADTTGEHEVTVRVRFWVCGGKACRPVDVKRTANVIVAPPAPPPSDAGVD
jgi:hypothetical protein